MEKKNKGFIFIAVLFTTAIIGMVSYGIWIGTSAKSREFVKDKIGMDNEIQVKIDKKKDKESNNEAEDTAESAVVRNLNELNTNQEQLLVTLGADNFFQDFPANLSLFQEIKQAKKIGESFLVELRMSNTRIVFSDQLVQEAVVQIKYYQKSEEGSNLEYEFTEGLLKLGLKPKVLDLPANIRLRAFVILPLMFKELFFEASAADYQLDAVQPLICKELVLNTNAANGQINLAKLTADELHVMVNAAATNLTINELELINKLEIKNNAAKLTSHINKLTGEGKSVEITQNVSQSNLFFKNLNNYLIRGDIKLGSVDVNLSDKTENYNKSFTLKNGTGEIEIKIELMLGEVNITL